MKSKATQTGLAGAAIASLVVGSAATSAEAGHIDQFLEGTGEALLLGLDSDVSKDQTYTDSNGDTVPLFGNSRFEQIEYAPGPEAGLEVGAAQVNVSDGVYSFSNGPNTRGTLTLRYGDNGNNADLVTNGSGPDYQALRITIDSIDPGNTANFSVIADDGGSSDTQGFASASGGDFFLPYSSFSGVDFSSLDSLEIQAVGDETGLDVDIEEVFRAIPEPASLTLLGLGGSLLLLRRRTRRGGENYSSPLTR